MSFTIFQNEKTPFQAIKKEVHKVEKLLFFQRVNPRFRSKNRHFFNFFFFQAIWVRKMSFTIFQNKKKKRLSIPKKNGAGKCLLRYSRTKKRLSRPKKKKNSKSRKIAIFPKGLTHGFGRKMALFPTLFFQVNEITKISFTIFWNVKMFLQPIKTRNSKSRKIAIILKGLTHGFCTKMAIFPSSFFQAIWGRKISFTIFQTKKKRLPRP